MTEKVCAATVREEDRRTVQTVITKETRSHFQNCVSGWHQHASNPFVVLVQILLFMLCPLRLSAGQSADDSSGTLAIFKFRYFR